MVGDGGDAAIGMPIHATQRFAVMDGKIMPMDVTSVCIEIFTIALWTISFIQYL